MALKNLCRLISSQMLLVSLSNKIYGELNKCNRMREAQERFLGESNDFRAKKIKFKEKWDEFEEFIYTYFNRDILGFICFHKSFSAAQNTIK